MNGKKYMFWENGLKKCYFKSFQKLMILVYLRYKTEFLFISFVIKTVFKIEHGTLDSI